MTKRRFLLWLLLSLGLLIFSLQPALLDKVAKIFPPQVAKQSENDQKFASAPEMADILGGDQNTRLAAGRRLVERVDVEQALEILKNSPLPNTGEGHLVIHQIGFYAYQKYGLDSILKCKDYFLFGCYHGAIIEAASGEGFAAIKKMVDRCQSLPARHFQCAHAAGHSILAIWNYDLPQALKTCDSLFETSPGLEILSSCHNGAFMENLFGVHDWGKDKVVKRDWLSADPYFPCNAFGEKYQRGCWLNQAARIYQMSGGDLSGSALACEGIGVNQHQEWCLDNLSRQIHALSNNDIGKVFALCQTLGDWRDKCIVVNAGAYYSVGGRHLALDICRLVVSSQKPNCYANVISQFAAEPLPASDRVQFCQRVEKDFAPGCWQQFVDFGV